MKLIVKNKVFSIGGSSIVTDENENKLFKVKGKVFTITKKKKIYDMEGNKLFTVRNKYWSFFLHSAYIFDGEGNKIAKLQNKFKRDSVYISEGFEDSYRIGKDPERRGMSIFRNEEFIGNFIRSTIFIDSFEVTYDNPEDAPMLAALIIAIDNIEDRYRDKKRD